MCRHMVSGKNTFKVMPCGRSEMRREKDEVRQDERGGASEIQIQTERITQSPPLLPNQSMRLICLFLSFCDPISME